MLLRQRGFGYANNRPFGVLKLRTMRYGPSDACGTGPTLKGDPRITRIGRFFCAGSIDELLRLINSVRGLVDTLEEAERRVEYDLEYVDGWSLPLDLRILWATLLRGFVHESAC
jgi:lipopolysaccharide/colanic/teichoic acid biosynthesis glycosyltransferase